MKEQLINSIKQRLKTDISERSTMSYLKNLKVEDYIDLVISTVYLYTRSKKGYKKSTVYMVEVIAAIGHGIRNKYKFKRDSSLAAKTGAFILYSFEALCILQVILGQGSKGHGAYIIQVIDDDSICKLWDSLDPSQIEKLPSEKPYKPWTSTKHETGVYLVKTGNRDVLNILSPETHPIIFESINKSQAIGWKVNEYIYDIHSWALRNKTEAFSDIWDLHNPEAKATKLREAKAIGNIAKKFIGKIFHHLYYYDFRGRKYPATAYFHEQGSDLARGLLLRADSKPIGKDGFFWLMITIANNWAGESGREDNLKTDKIPLNERYLWALDNEEILLSYAENPKVNQGWMKADKPWQMLAACNELMKLRIFQTSIKDFENYEYPSHLECFIDGSNNGSQHLAALTRDEVTAQHVNLVPMLLPGDLYKYVSNHVWKRLENIRNEYTKEEINECEKFIDNLIELKKQINEAEPKSDQRKIFISQIQSLKDKNKALLHRSAPIFWLRIKDNKYQRKIVKRNVMTLPYGGTAYGLGEQQISDAKKHGLDMLFYMEHYWGAFLGREIFDDCRISLRRPMQLLHVFEDAGKRAEMTGNFLSWTVPITNFPVIQNYTEGKVKKIWVQYGPPMGEKLNTGYYINTLQLAICFIEDVKPSKGKQSQGASPNAIHSLDAAHLALTTVRAPFPITTIHDSYGCLFADMPDLFRIVRETFVELYNVDPLMKIMKDINGDISKIEFGTLNINDILKSEYCFA